MAKKKAARKRTAKRSTKKSPAAKRAAKKKRVAKNKAASRAASKQRTADNKARVKALKEAIAQLESELKSEQVSKPEKRTAGRPPFEPTPEQRKKVLMLAGVGVRTDDIALMIENPTTGKHIEKNTLLRHFSRELELGAPIANSMVAQSLYKKALGDGPQAVTAGIWYSKCRMGWRGDHVQIDVDVKSGVLVAPANRSPEEWIAEAAARTKDKKEPGTEGSEGSEDGE